MSLPETPKTESNAEQAETVAAPPQTARVVIIGGGIMGCALAYHLGKIGWTDCVLLEKAELTSGSTWHAAGQITRATSSRSLGECVDYNLKLYQHLQAETGQSATYHGCGSLRMAYNQDEADWLAHILSACRGLNFEADIVNPERIRELHPFYDTDGIQCALHTPDDGHLDPAGAAFALAKGARMSGVRIIRKCRATGVQQTESGEWQVQTDRGDIMCEHVVNAGGMYARQIALWNGYDLPTTSMTHHYFVTGPVAEFANLEKEFPVVRDDRTVSGYVRMEQKSGLVGIYEKENPNTVWDDGAPWEAEHELFEPHYPRVEKYLAGALSRMPVLERAGIRRVVHGAISHPPDGMPLVGPAPGLKNYWCFCGCQIGIGWGPALALHLALWMSEGAADISMREFDPRRFGPEATRKYQIAKGREDYILRHEVPFPHFNRLAARPVGKSPLYDILKDKGAVYEEAGGWERPRWFAKNGVPAEDIYSFRRSKLHDIVGAEEQAVRNRAGVMDISAFAKVEVCGADAASFLSALIPNRLPRTGKSAMAHFLSDNGRLELEAFMMRTAEDRFYITCAAFFEHRLLDYLMFRRNKSKVEIINRSRQWAAVTVNGPQASAIVKDCLPAPVAELPWLSVHSDSSPSFGKGEYLACKMSYAGEAGWEVHGTPDIIAAIYQAFSESGTPNGLVDYGSFAMNGMRMEKAFPGASELTNEITLPEAGLTHFIDKQKSAYIGKEATDRALHAPLRWKLAFLEVASDGKDDGAGSEAIFYNKQRTGSITSIAFGHATQKLLAFAYLHPDHASANTKLEVIIAGKPRAAQVVESAPYDPQNTRPKGS